MPLALEGLTVVDISQGIPGPLCAMQLGDLGARVIKVEPPEGDWLRRIGPFINGESSLLLQLNRNKHGVAIDLKTPEGKELVTQLTQTADILVEGYRPGVAERLGFGFDTLAARNPRMVYCSISAFGSVGPMAGEAGTELALQSMIGYNRHLGVAGEEPLRAGFDMACVSAAWSGIQGTMAALYSRERTGKGQKVETSMLAALMAIWQWNVAAESKPDEWKGKELLGYTDPPDHGYATRDGRNLFTFMRDEAAWQQFCKAIGADYLLSDPRFANRNARTDNDALLKSILNEILSSWSYEDLQKLVRNQLGGTIVPMHNLESLLQDPQVEAMEVVGEMEHPVAGKVKTLNPQWHFSLGLTRRSFSPPPLLGQHTDEVLGQLGHAASRIAELRQAGTVK